MDGGIETKVMSNFIVPDADAICRIPTNPTVEDTWAWNTKKLENFSVRSAYKLLISRQDEQSNGSSNGMIMVCKSL